MIWYDPVYSDKHYWHRFTEFYRWHLSTLGSVSSILEYGVLDGASIRWLRQMFPQAEIVGVDILPQQPGWPTGPGIAYLAIDQGDRPGIARMLQKLERTFDLVIEDGSHIPAHQAHCLAETFPLLRAGGMYILEDLHTSHPQHPYYKAHCKPGTPDSLHLLLLIEHLHATGQTIQPGQVEKLASVGIFGPADVRRLFGLIAQVNIFRRATLPLRCYACGKEDFDPVTLTCLCGADVDMMSIDSMTSVLRRVGTDNQVL